MTKCPPQLSRVSTLWLGVKQNTDIILSLSCHLLTESKSSTLDKCLVLLWGRSVFNPKMTEQRDSEKFFTLNLVCLLMISFVGEIDQTHHKYSHKTSLCVSEYFPLHVRLYWTICVSDFFLMKAVDDSRVDGGFWGVGTDRGYESIFLGLISGTLKSPYSTAHTDIE